MRIVTLATAATIVFVATAPAWAEDCAQTLSNYNSEVVSSENYRSAIAPGQQSDMRRLRDAALILSATGHEEACEEVVAAIKDMVENPPEAPEGGITAEEWHDRELERLKSATNLEDLKGQLRAEEIIGSDIRNMENEDLGEIEDILLATKNDDASYAIVSHGGFLGLGEKQIAIPMTQLKVTEDKDIYILNISEDELERAPSFDRGEFETVSDENWRRANDEYFSK